MEIRLPFWLLATVLLMGASVLIASPGSAQEKDHLKCYNIEKSVDVKQSVTLTNRFGTESCVVRADKSVCVATVKDGADDPLGSATGDFILYNIRACDRQSPTSLAVEDQFGSRVIRIKQPQELLVPAGVVISTDE